MRPPETNGGRLLKRGDTRDRECHRTTHRLSVARAILRAQGVEPTTPKHFDSCARSVFVLGQNRALQPCTCGIGDAEPVWPEWCDGEVFDAAYRLADLLQTKRGAANRAEASRLHAAANTPEARMLRAEGSA